MNTRRKSTNRVLKRKLDRLYRTFDLEYLSPDPLEFVHRFASPGDREVVALVASSLAYGRVEGIRRSVEKVLAAMGPEPYEFIVNSTPAKTRKLLPGFSHRFNTGNDIRCLIHFAKLMIEQCGSIGGFFEKGYTAGDVNVKQTLVSFSARALQLDSGRIYGAKSLPKGAGVRFFFPSPEGGSPCKRLNLMLRWMVRSADDGLDFGQWRWVEPSKLIIPLDTHIARISRKIGLTHRTNPGWRMAEEITEALRALDPRDPVKYDFSLSRLGILNECPKKMDPRLCEKCLIKEVCVL